MHVPGDARDVSEARCIKYLERTCQDQCVLETDLLDPVAGRYIVAIISFGAVASRGRRIAPILLDVHSSKPVRCSSSK
jgi:hypothetical protein